MNEQCFEGWAAENGNILGRCCCNCEYQQPVVAHPWNKNTFAAGPVSKVIGWGCHGPDMFPAVTLFEKEHGMCEMHKFRTPETQKQYEEWYGYQTRTTET